MKTGIAVMIMLWCLSATLLAASEPAGDPDDKEPRWWQQRKEQRPEHHFPHNQHEAALQDAGISCLACHPFSRSREYDMKVLKKLTTIANEPLKAICHICHVDDRSAPSACVLCHPQPEKVWPQDHNSDYLRLHGPAVKDDESACKECHLELADCISCHFHRNDHGSQQHEPGYRYSHGIEARVSPLECGACHNASFCSDCHQRTWFFN